MIGVAHWQVTRLPCEYGNRAVTLPIDHGECCDLANREARLLAILRTDANHLPSVCVKKRAGAGKPLHLFSEGSMT